MARAVPTTPTPTPTPTAEAQRLLNDCVRVEIDARDSATTISVASQTGFDDDHEDESDDDDDAVYHRSSNRRYDSLLYAATPPRWQGTERPGWLYRFATTCDDLLLAVGVASAVASGALVALSPLAVGDTLSGVVAPSVDGTVVSTAAHRLLAIACGVIVLDVASCVAFDCAATRQVKVLRSEIVRRFLLLDTATRDQFGGGRVVMSDAAAATIYVGIGRHLGATVQACVQFVVALVLAVATGGRSTVVALVVLAGIGFVAVVLLAICLDKCGIVSNQSVECTEAEQVANTALDIALYRMRAVAALNAQAKAGTVVNAPRAGTEVAAAKLAAAAVLFSAGGLMLGCVLLVLLLLYGSERAARRETKPVDVLESVLCILILVISTVQGVCSSKWVVAARDLVSVLSQMLNSTGRQQTSPQNRYCPDACDGAIAFHSVGFDGIGNHTLANFTLTIDSGATVVIVDATPGDSTSSLLVPLLQRLRTADSGEITLDDEDIEDLDVTWLRQQIAVIDQKPVLFRSMSIYQNIAAGAVHATRTKAVAAAKRANVHDAIMSLANQYDTLIGDISDETLSEDQQQLLVIARSLVRDPTILILDHVTDRREGEDDIVHATLSELIQTTRATTLVLTDRVDRMAEASDLVVVMKDGRVVERGPHAELMRVKDSVYEALCRKAQQKCSTASVKSELTSSTTSQESTPQPKQQSVYSTADEEMLPRALSIGEVVALSAPSKLLFCVGTVAALASGCAIVWLVLSIADTASAIVHQYGVWLHTQTSDDLKHVAISRATFVTFAGRGLVVVGTSLVATVAFTWMGVRLESGVRDLFFRALSRQDLAYLEKHGDATPHSLAQEVMTSGKHVGWLFGSVSSTLVILVAALATVSTVLVAAGSSMLGLLVWGVVPLRLGIRHISRRSTTALHDTMAASRRVFETDLVKRTSTIVSLGLEEPLADTYRSMIEASAGTPITGRELLHRLIVSSETFTILASLALTIGHGASLVAQGELSVDAFFRTLTCLLLAFPIVRLADPLAAIYLKNLQDVRYAGARIVALQQRRVAIDVLSTNGQRPRRCDGAIEFHDVTFRDPKAAIGNGLVAFSATIHAGETVVFCGAPDGGQSSIAALLERFYDPTEGEVQLDGVALGQLNVAWLRSRVGLVSRNPFMVPGTFADNMTLGLHQKNPSQRRLEAASQTANAHGFITGDYPCKYDTKVRWAASRKLVVPHRDFKNGERQCIGLARAMLKKPSVLVLDNVAATLDSDGRTLVADGVAQVLASKKRTTIIIGHELSSAVQRADKIFVLGDGRVVEQGTHEQLVASGGAYAKLVASEPSVAAAY